MVWISFIKVPGFISCFWLSHKLGNVQKGLGFFFFFFT